MNAICQRVSLSLSGLRFVSPRRLQDWLAVLGFELQQEVKYLAYELPFTTRNKDAGIWRKLRALCADLLIRVEDFADDVEGGYEVRTSVSDKEPDGFTDLSGCGFIAGHGIDRDIVDTRAGAPRQPPGTR